MELTSKLKSLLIEFRKGEIDSSLIKLESIQGHEIRKYLIKAQINYLKEEHDKAMEFTELALPHNHHWYAGNILTEHFFAYSNTAIKTNQIARAKDFYEKFLKNKLESSLPEHKSNFYTHQITQHIKKLDGQKNLIIDFNKPYQIINEGKSIAEISKEYQKSRKTLNLESIDAKGYIMYFLTNYGNTKECLEYYESNWKSLLLDNTHFKIAQIYTSLNLKDKAIEVILRATTKFWRPVDHLQIVPIKIWTYEDLLPFLDKEMKLTILYANKELK